MEKDLHSDNENDNPKSQTKISKETPPQKSVKTNLTKTKRIKKHGEKIRNLLKDPKVLQDIEQLFEDLKGSKEDDFVDSSTILFLMNMLEISKNEPEYFWYIYTQVKDIEKLSKAQFVELFMNPPEYQPKDIEDIKNLFSIFDGKGKGAFGKEDFVEFFKFSPIYQSDPELVESNLERCFKNLEKVFGNKEISPVEFYQIMHHLK